VVTEIGTHSDLLRTSEHYRYLISSLDTDRTERTERTTGSDEPNRSTSTREEVSR